MRRTRPRGTKLPPSPSAVRRVAMRTPSPIVAELWKFGGSFGMISLALSTQGSITRAAGADRFLHQAKTECCGGDRCAERLFAECDLDGASSPSP